MKAFIKRVIARLFLFLLGKTSFEKARIKYYQMRLKTLPRIRRHACELIGVYIYSRKGLLGLDEKLQPYLGYRNGVFIEVGANDGATQSNTYYLEKALGWSGVLVEALPRLYKKCVVERKHSQVFNYALVAPENEGKTIAIRDFGDNGLMSSVSDVSNVSNAEVVTIEGRTLTSILDASKVAKIDFFSLDVEGYEIEVLKGLDFARFKPTYLLVETEQIEAVDQLLGSTYSRIAKPTFHDYLYKANDE